MLRKVNSHKVVTKKHVRIQLPARIQPPSKMYRQQHEDALQTGVRYQLDNFDIRKKIGKGQFSYCYKVRLKTTGQAFALKRIQVNMMKDKKMQEDCMKEIDLLRKLDHENIIHYYTMFFDTDYMYIVLELADAGDLNVMLKYFKKNRRLLPEATIWKYFVQIMRGLAFMHSKSIMHRDIKPANIFITAQSVAKLGDLGLGRFFSNQTHQAHSIVGTPYYMSPERMNETGYNFKSDIWSVGCLLYEMAALQSPFYAEKLNLYALVRKIEKCEYPPIPSNLYSQQLRLLVSNCICSDPQMRFSAAQVCEVAERMNTHYNGQQQSSPAS